MKKIGRGWVAILRSSRDYIRRDKEQIREKICMRCRSSVLCLAYCWQFTPY
jgi:hypothetical protein